MASERAPTKVPNPNLANQYGVDEEADEHAWHAGHDVGEEAHRAGQSVAWELGQEDRPGDADGDRHQRRQPAHVERAHEALQVAPAGLSAREVERAGEELPVHCRQPVDDDHADDQQQRDDGQQDGEQQDAHHQRVDRLAPARMRPAGGKRPPHGRQCGTHAAASPVTSPMRATTRRAATLMTIVIANSVTPSAMRASIPSGVDSWKVLTILAAIDSPC